MDVPNIPLSKVMGEDKTNQNVSFHDGEQGCQIFLRPNIPKRENYTK
jgi:hypothetical protein